MTHQVKESKTTYQLSDDLLAIYIASSLVLVSLLAWFMGEFKFLAVKFKSWHTLSELGSQLLSAEFLKGFLLTGLILNLIFIIYQRFKGRHELVDSFKAFTGVYLLASLVYILSSQLTMKQYLEYAFWALVVGLLVSNVFGLSDWMKPALKSDFYIKVGLVLMGTEVIFANITKFGLYGIAIVLLVVPLTMLFMWYFGTKVLQMEDPRFVMVIATATAVCGVSAAIASAAAVKAQKEDLSFAVSISILFTIVMMVAMPFIAQWLHFGELIGGAWIGNTVDSTGAVVLAGEALGPLASQVASLIKMIQNLLIGFIVFILALYFARQEQKVALASNEHVEVHRSDIWDRLPKFILGFIGMSMIFSFIIMPMLGIETTNTLISGLGTWKGWFFCLTFLSIGLETNLKTLKQGMEGGKPLSLYVGGQTFSLVLSIIVCWLLLSGHFLPIPDLQVFGG